MRGGGDSNTGRLKHWGSVIEGKIFNSNDEASNYFIVIKNHDEITY